MAAALFQSAQIAAFAPAIVPERASNVVAVRNTVAISKVAEVGDTYEMVILPANCVVVDMILDADDLSTAADITMDVGIMAGNPYDTTLANRTCGKEFIDASTIGQAGGVFRPTLKGCFRVAPSKADRSIGIEMAAVATATSTGTIGLTVLYRPAVNGA
jgi:hypothetical protein